MSDFVMSSPLGHGQGGIEREENFIALDLSVGDSRSVPLDDDGRSAHRSSANVLGRRPRTQLTGDSLEKENE